MSEAVVGGLFGLLAVVMAARLAAGEFRARLRKAILEDVQLLGSATEGRSALLEAKIEQQMDRYLKPADPGGLGAGFWLMEATAISATVALLSYLDSNTSLGISSWLWVVPGAVVGGLTAYADILRIKSANRRHGLA